MPHWRECYRRKKEKLLRQLAQSGVSPSRIPIIKADPAQAIPLSFNQERLWFLQKYDSTATNYNLYVVYRLHGVVDMPMLTGGIAPCASTPRHLAYPYHST